MSAASTYYLIGHFSKFIYLFFTIKLFWHL